MSVETKYYCDSCSEEIKRYTGCERYVPKLDYQILHQDGNISYGMLIHRDFSGPLHFCGVKCLKNYVLEKF